nr:hypothetical protein [Halomonas sp. DQ26W]
MFALAHDHANQQRLRRPRQHIEVGDEAPLVIIQEIVVALAHPAENEMKVR